MIRLLLTHPDGRTETLELPKDDIVIGRVKPCDVVLDAGNVSKRHARIVVRDGRVIVADLKSTNGTFLNDRPISAPKVLRAGDQLKVGDTQLEVLTEGAAPAQRPAATPARTTKRKEQADPGRSVVAQQEVARHAALLKEIHNQLIDYLDLRRMDINRLGDQELRDRTAEAIGHIIDKMIAEGDLDPDADRDGLTEDVLNEALGLGPLEEFLADDSISEVMVNHSRQIYIERDGKLTLVDKVFSSDTAVLAVIERIVAPLGRRIDESSPMVDARLKDGSRVNAIIPPLALKGPSITIRKFMKEKLQIDDLVRFGSLTPQMGEFLKVCVEMRKNVIVSGGTGSGKTTTLNVLSNFIPTTERIVTVEDAAELQLVQDHWVALESRPANIEGKGQIAIRDLVRNCLRMRPDRIVVGECRGGEAIDMLQAMNTGHDGSLTTVHANSPRDSLSRLETMVLMSGMDLPIRAIREQVSSAVDIVVQQSRIADGSRKIVAITEITGMEIDVITMQDIFLFKQTGFDKDGKVLGTHQASGFVPSFYDGLRQRGIAIDMSIFDS